MAAVYQVRSSTGTQYYDYEYPAWKKIPDLNDLRVDVGGEWDIINSKLVTNRNTFVTFKVHVAWMARPYPYTAGPDIYEFRAYTSEWNPDDTTSIVKNTRVATPTRQVWPTVAWLVTLSPGPAEMEFQYRSQIATAGKRMGVSFPTVSIIEL